MTDQQFKLIQQELKDMRVEMKPVIDTFNTLRTLGKWTALSVAFVGSVTAVAVGWKELFKR